MQRKRFGCRVFAPIVDSCFEARFKRIFTLTPYVDSKTMLETVVWLNINGKPEITTNRFNRVE
ncbi:hypothetical protein [Xanthomonas sp. SI]|uniref:hypothetical protein n=1 Tax=Xanthomonas sp. SI TaxID=2724123 RepID=UPI00163AB778|nr:hypothetical protein [Xanthomonas sp. SI]QNH14827.1 hypothetical protein HEP75_04300 [Xanthomonas sp. SI]